MFSRLGALLLGLWGDSMVIGAAGGAHDPLQPLHIGAMASTLVPTFVGKSFMSRFAPVKTQQALDGLLAAAGQRSQWTLVDFYADWCVSCGVIEREVFGDPRVQQALGNMQLLLIDPDGQERRVERIIGELGADEFLARLAQARQGK